MGTAGVLAPAAQRTTAHLRFQSCVEAVLGCEVSGPQSEPLIDVSKGTAGNHQSRADLL